MSVRITGLRKAFGGAIALDGVDLTIEPGEVHALLGPNGAGKTTLIRCLSGGISPDSGEIAIEGRAFDRLNPRQAIDVGIAVIYQNFSLIGALTVAENIFLGSELRGGLFVRKREQRRRAAELLSRFRAPISPNEIVGHLPVASKQLVEIAKALRHEARLLILDEPTASLSELEARVLADHLNSLKNEGIHILYVTHLLKEVFEVADRVTVLRDGRVVLSAPVGEVTQADLVSAIAGSPADLKSSHGQSVEAAPPLLEMEELIGPGIGPVSAAVRGGEIVGIFGLLGSGRTELVETVFGLRKRTGGRVLLAGRPLSGRSPADSIACGVALVPAERLRQSMLLTLSALDNVLLPSFRHLTRAALRRKRAERKAFAAVANRLRIRPARPELPAWTFSGGNQQKVALGRWLGAVRRVSVLLLDEPTQGIDVGTRDELYRILRETVAGGGRGVLFTSSDPEEVVAVADRAFVLHRGQIVGELGPGEITEDALLSLAHAAEVA